MENAPTTRQNRSDGVALIIFFAIFVLGLTLLIVSIRLLQQDIGGIAPVSLLIFSLVGIVAGIFGLISSSKPSTEASPPDTAVAFQAATRGDSEDKVRLEQLVQMLEEQVKSLQEEKSTQVNSNVQLRGEAQALEHTVSEWQERSLEVFRMIERVVNSDMKVDDNYKQAMLRTKQHFSKLVAPMGVSVIEPQRGERFDDKMHHIVDEEDDSFLPPWVVADCREWGYSLNGQVEIPAKVVISRRG